MIAVEAKKNKELRKCKMKGDFGYLLAYFRCFTCDFLIRTILTCFFSCGRLFYWIPLL